MVAYQLPEVDFADDDIANAIEQVKEKFNDEASAIELVEIGGGFQFMTKAAYHGVIATWLKQTTNKRLAC